MQFTGIFYNEINQVVDGAVYVNGVFVQNTTTGSFSVPVDADEFFLFEFIPADSNYWSYEQNFSFPNLDLPLFTGIVGNKTQPRPICNFYTIQNKCDTTVCLYHAASGPVSEIVWTFWQGNQVLSTNSGNRTCYTYRVYGPVRIGAEVKLCEPVVDGIGATTSSDCCGQCCGSDPIILNCTTATCYQDFTIVKTIPSLSLTLDCVSEQTNGDKCACNCLDQAACKCVAIGSTTTVKINIDRNNDNCFFGSGITITDCSSVSNTIEITDCSTEPISTGCVEIIVQPPALIQFQNGATNPDAPILVGFQTSLAGPSVTFVKVRWEWDLLDGFGWRDVPNGAKVSPPCYFGMVHTEVDTIISTGIPPTPGGVTNNPLTIGFIDPAQTCALQKYRGRVECFNQFGQVLGTTYTTETLLQIS